VFVVSSIGAAREGSAKKAIPFGSVRHPGGTAAEKTPIGAVTGRKDGSREEGGFRS